MAVEATKIENITGPNGDVEIYELYEANQPLQYNIHFKGEESTVFMTLGEAYLEAGKRAGVKT